jgi:hypothetical protein
MRALADQALGCGSSIRINLNMGGAYHIELSASIGFGSLRLERDFRVRDESKCLRAIHDYPSVFA